MSQPSIYRQWEGDWGAEAVRRFEALMRRHAPTFDGRRWRKPTKGTPALVSAWDDGRGRVPWYSAMRTPEEVALYQRVCGIFGCEATTTLTDPRAAAPRRTL